MLAASAAEWSSSTGQSSGNGQRQRERSGKYLPNGPTHDKLTVLAALGSSGLALYATLPWPTVAILGGSVLFSGLMFSPDLDLDSSIDDRWGPFKILWVPYEKILRHRSPFSHWPILGSLTRLIYFPVMVGLMLWMGLMLRDVIQQQAVHPLEYLSTILGWFDFLTERLTPEQLRMFLIGIEVGAASHYLADYSVSGFKKLLKA